MSEYNNKLKVEVNIEKNEYMEIYCDRNIADNDRFDVKNIINCFS